MTRPPSIEDVVDDLKLLRQKGLLRCSTTSLPALAALAVLRGLAPAPNADNVGVERLLRAAVAGLGEEEPGRAVQYLFGLVPGTIGRRPTDLREAAAREYGQLSPETFRKRHEPLLIRRVAQQLLAAETIPMPRTTDPGTVGAEGIRADLAALAWEQDPVDGPPGTGSLIRRYGPYRIGVGGGRDATVIVDLGPVEELGDVHVIVSSENTYLMPARPFSGSLSGSLRRAAQLRASDGSLVDDIVASQLQAWLIEAGRPGGPVEPGVVAMTSPGNLTRRGVLSLLHAAVAVPRVDVGGYLVERGAISRAVTRCFELGRELRQRLDEPVESMLFPLFGGGEGALPAARAASWVWSAVYRELCHDPTWRVHLATWTLEETREVLALVAGAPPATGLQRMDQR